ncbi:AsmA family protein [Falsiroseomonas sp. CW058]|uniref:AsmA family protein n=1 Tax=Falsiroseomonas sp. CW058 TaxID=3388664 RepID=UPI003D314684
MRKVAAAAGLLLLLVLAGLWLGPRAVNWESWRGRLAEIATDRLGRPVTLDGAVELVLLPQPMLRAGGVSIGGMDDEARVTARLLRLRLDLTALLGGRLEPRELALVGADVTLPWPPGALLAFRPPTWITEFDARIEDGRIRLGDAVLEGVTASLSSGGAMQALEIAGGFALAGRAARFTASLGRPGWDGISTFEGSLALPELSGRLRGVLVPGAGFEGSMEVRGPDLAALVPSPGGAFRAAGRLTANAELIAGEELAMEIGGSPARGAIALRLLPAPRLDISLIASRLDLDGWVQALRTGGARPWPVAIDLSAEAAAFRGQTLRRLRGTAFLEDQRLTLTDVSVLLPGETELDFAGATAGGRLEIGARFAGADLRPTLAAFGLPVEGLDPALLRRGEGRLRLVLEEAQAGIPEFSASFEGFRLSGAGVMRHGSRPALGMGLTIDRLDLPRWLPGGLDLAATGRAFATLDVNLRLAAERASWDATVLERAALDVALEGGRLTLRRLSGQLAGADVAASGVVTFAPQVRLQDLSLEMNGPHARGLAALVPGAWPDGTALAGQRLSLRLAGGGTPDALALRGGAEIGELRLEATGTADLLQRRGTASLTLRHPGAPRLLAEAFGSRAGTWLGEGSFSLVATVSAGPQALAADSFEIVAGGLRGRGALTLATGARPRLTGRIAAERLPLPLPGWRSTEPLGLPALAGFDAEIAFEAARIEAGELVVDGAAAALRLEGGRLQAEGIRGRIAGGTLEATLLVDVPADAAPQLVLEARLAEATVASPLLGLPFDLAAGRGEVGFTLLASGHSPAALLGTLEGRWRASLRDGVLTGFDLAAATAASGLPDPAAAEAAVRRALTSGATAFDRLDLEGQAEGGRLRVTEGRATTEGGATAILAGEVDLPRGSLDLRITVRPAAPDAPEPGLRLTGPAEAPRALPETAAWARWRAERG